MNSIKFMATVLAVAFLTLSTRQSSGAKPVEDDNESGFISLFDGKTFDHWLSPTSRWSIEDGQMMFSGKATSSSALREEHKLLSITEYEDFVLRFEFKIDKRANSGVAVRAPLQGDAAFVAMEIQIIDQLNWKGLKAWQQHGSIYGVVAAKTGHLKQPGEWNTEEIICQGSHVKVTLNGAVILDVDLEEQRDKTLDGKKHPGLKRTKGHIGFLPHTKSSAYRNVRIKELAKTSDVDERVDCVDRPLPAPVRADELTFLPHVIKPARPGAKDNTVPSMVWLDDVDRDGQVDLIASHVAWMTEKTEKGYVYPYTAWYKGPEFRREYVMIDKNSFGAECRIYRFVMFDVDGDGRKDLIGQGYQPHSNLNHWYRCPDDPMQPWRECYNYGRDLKNGHDIRLRDIDGDGRLDLVLLDSHSGKIIIKRIPTGEAARKHWPYQLIAGGDGFTHYMSFYDVNGDDLEDIVIAKEEDGGKGIRWYEHPRHASQTDTWRRHFVVDANFTKAFARDLDGDGDVDFIGTGEGYGRGDFGWCEKTDSGYTFHEFDVQDNDNDIIGGHNCELVDVDGDGDEDLIVGGVDKKDGVQRFRWYEFQLLRGRVRWVEHAFGVTSVSGFKPGHGFYCGEMAYGDMDGDGDQDFVYAGHGGGFLGWFENVGSATTASDRL